jgi:hypothetical protein
MASALLYRSLSSLNGGENNMNARTNEATISGFTTSNEQTGEAMHRAQYAMLNELPGIVFGVLTIAWIVTSLFGLA